MREVDRTLVGEELTFNQAREESDKTLRERKTKSYEERSDGTALYILCVSFVCVRFMFEFETCRV